MSWLGEWLGGWGLFAPPGLTLLFLRQADLFGVKYPKLGC